MPALRNQRTHHSQTTVRPFVSRQLPRDGVLAASRSEKLRTELNVRRLSATSSDLSERRHPSPTCRRNALSSDSPVQFRDGTLPATSRPWSNDARNVCTASRRHPAHGTFEQGRASCREVAEDVAHDPQSTPRQRLQNGSSRIRVGRDPDSNAASQRELPTHAVRVVTCTNCLSSAPISSYREEFLGACGSRVRIHLVDAADELASVRVPMSRSKSARSSGTTPMRRRASQRLGPAQ